MFVFLVFFFCVCLFFVCLFLFCFVLGVFLFVCFFFFYSTDRFKRLLYSSASAVSKLALVLSLFVPHLSFFWYLGKAIFCDCGISWVSSLISFLSVVNSIGNVTRFHFLVDTVHTIAR